MDQSTVAIESRGAADWLTLNRPDSLNAITPRMATELADYFEAAKTNQAVRVVVIRGAGRGFCAGLDIKAFQDPQTSREPGINRLGELITNIRACPQPVVASVHGAASGGGFAIALAADIRIAGASARMNDAFIRLGLSGCELGLSHFLPRYVGQSVARELMYTGRFLSADRAERLGLVSTVVADEHLEAATTALVDEMLAVPPLALRRTKETFGRLADEDDLAEVIRQESLTQAECMRGPDFAEGLRAFVEKRRPSFTRDG